ncbi:MAG: hypothetical protein NVS9B10_06950 [Nevskia sp.]
MLVGQSVPRLIAAILPEALRCGEIPVLQSRRRMPGRIRGGATGEPEAMNRHTKTLIPTAVLSLLSGCFSPGAVAGTPVTASTATPLLRQGDAIEVRLRSATTDMALLDRDALRVADKIHQRYARSAAATAPEQGHYEIDVAIVNYSTGYDYIRAMTPYIGEVRVDAVVTVVRLPEGRQVGRLKITKTFDPGEVTNAASRIADIEEPFVQSVVDALQGVAAVRAADAGA